jgi:AAA domain
MALPSLADTDEHVNALFFGEGGSGKTTAALHMAKFGRVILVNAEAGAKKKPLKRLGVPIDRIHPYEVTKYEDLDNLYHSVKKMLDDDPTSIAGTVFDSVTEIQKKLTESLVEERHAKKIKAGMVDDVFETELKEFGKMTEMCRRICRRFRDLPCHTAFVCLDKRDVDSDGVVYRPDLTPKFAADLVGYVDIAVYTQQQAGDVEDRSRYIGTTRPIGKFRGKDRFGATPPVMANPTFDRLVEYVNWDEDEGDMDDPYQRAYEERMAKA